MRISGVPSGGNGVLRAGVGSMLGATSILALCAMGPAAAQSCTVQSTGPTVTCTGKPNLPVVYDNVATTTFTQLTADMVPAAGTAVATITNQGAAGGNNQQGGIGLAGTISYDSRSFGFATVGASGLTLLVGGGDGGKGTGSSGGNGAPGGAGGAGNSAGVTVIAPTVAVSGSGVSAIAAASVGGAGGAPNAQPSGHSDLTGGTSGAGGAGGAASVTATIGTMTIGAGAVGILAQSSGGAGGTAGSNSLTAGTDDITGSAGGAGGAGGTAGVTLALPAVTVMNGTAAGVMVSSSGGAGGTGGLAVSQVFDGQELATGGVGGAGGAAGSVTVAGSLAVGGTTRAGFVGVLAQSLGGAGGTGGDVSGGNGSSGGRGGVGGAGGDVSIGAASAAFRLNADLSGNGTRALAAISYGGAGGDGGETQNSYGQDGKGGAAAGGGQAGDVGVYLSGSSAATSGNSSDALFIQSIGGFSGAGPATAFGANGESFGTGGSVTLVGALSAGANGFGLSTSGNASDAVIAQSVGGGGGKALQDLGLTSLGSTSLAGGDGGTVSVSLSGADIRTSGTFSRGIYADSVGGGGGSGGADTGIATIGAAGGAGGDGGAVSVTAASAVATLGNGSDGIFAASRGGGGGSAMSAAGAFSIGGRNGGGGGNGGSASVDFTNAVSTAGDDADAITAQSVGGGGGDGASAVAAGVIYVQAIGGAGGTGGNAGAVTVSQTGTVQGAVRTGGARSRGVMAQSGGGGGGHGGYAVTATAVVSGYTHAVGGSGGTGGSGGVVQVGLVAPVATAGDLADGVFAQSIGGGGGSAGGVVDADVTGFAVQHGVGGSGGGGGNAAAVTVSTAGAVSTVGDHSAGVVAEAVGGGGGHSGIVVNGSVAGATVGVAVGGSGGSGGSVVGAVSVTTGAVATQGDASHGILARSVGGGGGHGGTVVSADAINAATLNVDLGGRGGNGGSADDVDVTADGAVSTRGAWSTAISAVSTGGGGGSGGVVATANAVSGANLDVSIGGNGGAGSSSGDVTVIASSMVQTAGLMSDGIYASSVGGFGGDAGVGLTSASAVNVASVGSVNVVLGGSGGAGGNAGKVTVTSAGDVSTAGLLSAGIYAQSVGGGGGRARGTVAANVADVGNVTVAVGGKGGTGGNAGDVAVATTNGAAAIGTLGAFSHGIVAQSIGGVGGSGGFAAEFSINVAAPDSGVTGQVGVTVGGGGAVGGRAGTVTVTNAAAIRTADFGSFGILAQTIGGHGGDGGNVYAGNLDVSPDASINIDVDVGGDGGFGATGNTVQVSNGGAITTGGYFSAAIAAQAIGGNGGNGGSTYTVLTQIGPGSPGNVQVSVGGSGGGGGKGGEVKVANQAALSTTAGGSDGIVAQSIGGGGGRGGSAGYIGVNLTPPVKFDNDSLPIAVNVNVGSGGTGGQGADGAGVTVRNAGSIATGGTRSRGIFAQSIGGGGGDGGTASATSFAMSDICNLGVTGDYVCPAGDGEEDVSVEINSTVQVGGDGGAAGQGGTVTIENSGNITTKGQLSHGIYAQSVGGGGGNGGEGALGIEAWTTNQIAVNTTDLPSNFLPSFSSNDVAVGGKASAGGDGGAVSITNSGAITILGPDASYLAKYTGLGATIANPLPFLAGGSGIFAQSVGGGGGDGGAGSSSLTAIVTVGNGGGAGGNGGAVTVNSTGAITNSSGFSGTGIFAQSVGGGGGVAGDVGLGFSDSWEQLNIGAGIAISASPGDGGDGGEVDVTSKGAIVTTGVASSGIVAQSVGGSGGIAAIASDNPKDTIYVGSGGAGGNGGDVTVTSDAAISVGGAGSVGIVAFSAGGTGSSDQSGTVTVNANADITASGKGGRGILAGSDSYQNKEENNGSVYINIAQGATVSTGATGAEAVGVINAGSDSTLTNSGTIVSGNADSYAVRVTTSNTFDIDNYGTISGSILGTSVKDGGAEGIYNLDNYGTLNTGSEITLQGVLSAFYSAGTLAPAGFGVIGETTVSSNLSIELAAEGTYQVDFDPSRVVSPAVVAGDRLTLGAPSMLFVEGAVTPNAIVSNPGNALRSGSVYILDSATAFDASLLTVADTSAVTYALSVSSTVQPNTDTLVLAFDIDTTPWSGPRAPSLPAGSLGRVNANHDRFGAYVDTLLFDDATSAAAGFVGTLGASVLNAKDLDRLLDIYDGYVADEALAVPDATYLSALAFSDELYSCGRRDAGGTLQFDKEGSCAWARAEGNAIDVDRDKAGPSYTEKTAGLSLGGQFEVATDTFLGLATSWQWGSLDFDGGDADVSRYLGGVSLKRELGPITIAGSVESGYFTSDTNRLFSNGARTLLASGGTDGYYLAGHVRASRRFETGALFIEPTADIGVTWLRQNAYTETGAGDFDMSLSALDQTTFSFNPFVNFGSGFSVGGMGGQLEFRAGLLALAGEDPSVDAAFVGAGAGGPTFAIENERTNLFADLGASIEMQVSGAMSVRGEFDALLSDEQTALGGRLRLNYSF